MSEDEIDYFIDIFEEIRLGPDPARLKRHKLSGHSLTGILTDPSANPSFAELLVGISEITPLERLTMSVLMVGGDDSAERLGKKTPALREKHFYIYGNVERPDGWHCSIVETGGVLSVQPTIGQSRKNIDLDYELFVVHSEPGHGRNEAVYPSCGDIKAQTVSTLLLSDEGWKMKPIGIMVRPDQRFAIFYQMISSKKPDLDDYYLKMESAYGDKRKIVRLLGDIGVRAAIVDFPFKKRELETRLRPFRVNVNHGISSL